MLECQPHTARWLMQASNRPAHLLAAAQAECGERSQLAQRGGQPRLAQAQAVPERERGQQAEGGQVGHPRVGDLPRAFAQQQTVQALSTPAVLSGSGRNDAGAAVLVCWGLSNTPVTEPACAGL